MRLLRKINAAGPTVAKKKLDDEWTKRLAYKQNIMKKQKRSLASLFSKRKEYLEKTFGLGSCLGGLN